MSAVEKRDPLAAAQLGRRWQALQIAAPSFAWLQEPLLHFLIIGALLVGANQLLSRLSPAEAILVDDARVERLSELYRLQTGEIPGPAEKEYLVQTYIKEEALTREARALGLDRDDAIVRRRLVQKMEFLEPEVVELPSDDMLRRYYEDNGQIFMSPSQISFTQLYFSPDRMGQDAAKRLAQEALAVVASSAPSERIASDTLPVPLATERQSVDDLARTFGASPIVEALLKAQPGIWIGPVSSGFGWHIIRVTDRSPPTIPPFEMNRDAAAARWQKDAAERARVRRLDALLAQYPVIRTDNGRSPK